MPKYTVVIDPGHGGEEYHGGEFGPYVEKDIDLIVARAFKEHLEKFEDVKVYLTREEDVAVELKERCEIAKKYNADFLISVHFNLSKDHDLFGAEVWLPIQNEYYSSMYPFASLLMNSFEDMGLFNRGIKTKLSSDRRNNYYAILRHSSDFNIPSCIIEHCHMDNLNDTVYLPIENYDLFVEKLEEFGRLDAEAFAKAYKLKSISLNEDYSSFEADENQNMDKIIIPDETAPEICHISIENIQEESPSVNIKIKAKDEDSYLLYYKYSLNGGESYSELFAWEDRASDIQYVSIDNLPYDTDFNLIVAVVNSFDVETISNSIEIPSFDRPTATPTPVQIIEKEYVTIDYENELSETAYMNEKSLSSGKLLNDILLSVMIFLVFFVLITIIFLTGKKKGKKHETGQTSDRTEHRFKK